MWRDTLRWRRQGNYLNEKASLGYILSFSSARERERREAGDGEGRNGERGREKMERGRKRRQEEEKRGGEGGERRGEGKEKG